MTFTHFGSFAAVGGEALEGKLTRPDLELKQDDVLFEARYLDDIWHESGTVYDMANNRYIPLAGYQRVPDGFLLTSTNGRTRKVSNGTWLYFSKRNLDFLPIAA